MVLRRGAECADSCNIDCHLEVRECEPLRQTRDDGGGMSQKG